MGIMDYISAQKKVFNEKKIQSIEKEALTREYQLKQSERREQAELKLMKVNLERENRQKKLSKARNVNFRNSTLGKIKTAGQNVFNELKSMRQPQGKKKSEPKMQKYILISSKNVSRREQAEPKVKSIFDNELSTSPFWDQGKKKKNPFYD